MTGALLLAAALAAPADDLPPDARADRAAAAFAAGVAARDDADLARPHFAAAAADYDALWAAGFRNPAVGLNRGRAHRLAGNLPAAVAALHAARAAAPADRALRVELDDARAAVAYPLTGDLAAQCRPPGDGGIRNRISEGEAFALAGLLAVAAGLAAVRFVMTRAPGWAAIAAGVLALLAGFGGLWWHGAAGRDGRAVVVAADDVMLRRGNAESYPPRLDPRLPRGAEAREVGRRGGWVQVELGGGAVGWLPESAVIVVSVGG